MTPSAAPADWLTVIEPDDLAAQRVGKRVIEALQRVEDSQDELDRLQAKLAEMDRLQEGGAA